MERNSDRWSPYVLVLSGPAGSGKSSVAVALWKSLPDRPAYIDLDALKNMIWCDSSDEHILDLASRNALGMLRNYVAAGHSVILDKAFGRYAFVEPFVRAGHDCGLPVHYFKLRAPLEVLIARNQQRWNYSAEELAQQARWRRFAAPDDNVRRIYQFFQDNLHPQGVELDTESVSLDETVTVIREWILRGEGTEKK